MFDHVKFGISDYAESKAFFLKARRALFGLRPGRQKHVTSATTT